MDTDALRRLPPEARRDLLRVLESDSRVRADFVRQFHERSDDGMVEVLAELEADKLKLAKVAVLATTSDSEAYVSLHVSEIGSTAADVMVTRWNCVASSEYEIDSRDWSWTWTSPDIWIDTDEDGIAEGLVPGRQNRVFVRIRNKASVGAAGTIVRLEYQLAGSKPSPTRWNQALDSTTGYPAVVGANLQPDEERVLSFSWIPPAVYLLGGTYFLRISIDTVGRSQAGSNKVAIAISTSPEASPTRPAPFRRAFATPAPRALGSLRLLSPDTLALAP